MATVIRAEKIEKKFLRKSGESNYFYAVKPQNFELEAGMLTVISGRSGSGKTTLLSMLSGLLTPSDGKVYVCGADGEQDLYQMTDAERSLLRSSRFGMIPQGRAVLDNLTVMENILLPGIFDRESGEGKGKRSPKRAETMLNQLGIGHLKDAGVQELSGGEVRRVSVVRALISDPEVVFADEPTGDLDDENTKLVLETLRAAADRGAAVLLVTHEAAAYAYADRVYRMDAGELTGE